MPLEAFLIGKNSPVPYLSEVPTFGQNLRQIRKASGRKAKEIAEVLDVAPSVMSGWENDRRGLPETPSLFKLAKALGCSIEDLLRGVDPDYSAMVSADRETGTTRGSDVPVTRDVGAPFNDVEDEHIDVSGYTRNDIPVIAEGEATPQGELFWDETGTLKSEVEDRISRPFDVKDPKAYGVKVGSVSVCPSLECCLRPAID